MTRLPVALSLAALLALAACTTPPAPPPEKGQELTVGKVQGEIKVGMDAASVAQILGSPNIVSTDEQRREVWIYDEVSTDRVDQEHSRIGRTSWIIVRPRSDILSATAARSGS